MATEVHPQTGQSVVGLLAGIIDDFQKLLTQQMDMVRAEIRSDWDRAKHASVPIVIGAGLTAIGAILGSLMLVFLLWWATAPAHADPAGVPLWVCFLVFSGAFLAGGIGCLAAGIHQFRNFTPLPEQSAEALKENVQWLTNPK
jgi:hypothetical protein